MNKDLKDKIAMLKKLAKKATRGEWFYSHNPVSGFGAYYACVGPDLRKLPAANTLTDLIHFNTAHMLPVCVIPGAYPIHNDKSDPLIEEQRANGAYITAANPETVLALVSELESLDKEADWLALALSELGNPENEYFDPNMNDCPNPGIQDSCDGDCQYCWREAARKGTQGQ